jgi:hypothetical protein
MRIALMSDAVWPTPLEGGHGLGRAVYNLGRELVKRGHAVTLLGAEGSALAGARVWTVPGGGGFGHEPTMARLVIEHAEEFDAFIDTSHTHALANARERTLPGLAWFEDCESYPAPCGVFVSDYTRRRVGQAGEIVYNAVVPDEYPLYTGPREGLLWMALNVPYKGQSTARVVAQIAGMPLSVYGTGTANGPLRGDAKIAALQHAAAYLFTSTGDAGPQTPLEAMACGTPVLALNRGGSPEYVRDGVNGWLCEDAHALANAAIEHAGKLTATAIRQSVIDGGFTVERQADEMLALLARVIGGERW